MANPNIVNVANIYGNTNTLAVSTVAANLVANPASSSTVYKINMLSVANINTFASAVTVNVQINQSGTLTAIAQNVVVPANATLIIIGRDTPLYLTENTSIQMTAGANTSLAAITSYEQIS